MIILDNFNIIGDMGMITPNDKTWSLPLPPQKLLAGWEPTLLGQRHRVVMVEASSD